MPDQTNAAELITKLTERVTRLEKRSRRAIIAVWILGALLAGIVTVGAAHKQAGVQDVVRANRIELVSSDGNNTVEISPYQIYLLDSETEESVSIYPDWMVYENPDEEVTISADMIELESVYGYTCFEIAHIYLSNEDRWLDASVYDPLELKLVENHEVVFQAP